MGGRQLLSEVNKCRHWLLPGIQKEGNAVQLKEALDFCVACCPELKLPGCSQEIYMSLQVVQIRRRRGKKKTRVWLRRQICGYGYTVFQYAG